MIKQYKHPVLFYTLSAIIPWIIWSSVGYLSYHYDTNDVLVSTISFIGLMAPFIIALFLILPNVELKRDLFNRLIKFKNTKIKYWLIALFLMLGSILLAQLISLLFGYSSNQFYLSGEYTFSSGVFPVWFLLIIAPLVEELAWHSYGTDSLRLRFNLFVTSMLFALYWGVWHIPLSFINGYYHSNLVESGIIYSVNFIISLFPFVIIMNWLYYKTGRNIVITIIFHISAGYFNEIFSTHPMSKVIQTGLLILLSIYLLIKDRKLFFKL